LLLALQVCTLTTEYTLIVTKQNEGHLASDCNRRSQLEAASIPIEMWGFEHCVAFSSVVDFQYVYSGTSLDRKPSKPRMKKRSKTWACEVQH
jgi:hypothetical protein